MSNSISTQTSQLSFWSHYDPNILVKRTINRGTQGSNSILTFSYPLISITDKKKQKIKQELASYNQIKHYSNKRILKYKFSQKPTLFQISRNISILPVLTEKIVDLTQDNALELMKSIANAVHNIHQKQMTHNLIRLQTIMIQNQNIAVLDIPFFARIYQYFRPKPAQIINQSSRSQICYSDKQFNLYHAPQVSLNSQLTQKSDIYALGIVYLQIFLRKIFHQRINLKQEIHAVKNQVLKRLIMKMVDKNPQKRPNIKFVFYALQREDSSVVEVKLPGLLYRKDIFRLNNRHTVFNNSLSSQQHHKKHLNLKGGNLTVSISLLEIPLLDKGVMRVKRVNQKIANNMLMIFTIKQKNDGLDPYRFVQTDETIKQSTKYCQSVFQLFQLIQTKDNITITFENSGYFNIFIKQEILVKKIVQKQLQMFKQINFFKLSDLSQKFNRIFVLSTEFQKESRYDISQIDDFANLWPQICEQLLKKKQFDLVKKICKSTIKRYINYNFEITGFGCNWQTKGLKEDQIIALYFNKRKKPNPYDILAICGLICHNYQSNYLFFKHLNQIYPNCIGILFGMVSIKFNSQQYQQCVKYYKQIMHLKPNFYIVQSMHSLCLLLLDQCQMYYLNVMRLRDILSKQKQCRFSQIIAELVFIVLSSKTNLDWKQQLKKIRKEYFREAQQIVYFIFGMIMKIKGKTYYAVQSFQIYAELNPKFPQTYFHLAELKAIQLKDKQALKNQWEWTQYQSITSTQSYFSFPIQKVHQEQIFGIMNKQNIQIFMKGKNLLENGSFLQAEQLFIKCDQQNQDQPIIKYYLALTYRRQTRYEDALLMVQQYIEMDPQSAKGYQLMGLINQDIGNIKEAILSFKNAVLIDQSVSYYSKLISLYSKIDDLFSSQNILKDRLRYLNKYIQLKPKESILYEQKAQILLMLRQDSLKQFAMKFCEELRYHKM